MVSGLDSYDQTIYNELLEHGALRYRKFEEIIVNKQGKMAKETFRKHLESLSKRKIIDKTEIEKQKVVYSIASDENDYEDPFKSYKEGLKNFEKDVKIIKKDFKKKSTAEKAEYLFVLAQGITFFEWQFIQPKQENIKQTLRVLTLLAPIKSSIIELALDNTAQETSQTLELLRKMFKNEMFNRLLNYSEDNKD
ncbi:MAG: hypothetical protein IIC67_06295 [Thaumarchaeota archaeon]|nr:hypothetical protein [Nitrososphaerota archaeon]